MARVHFPVGTLCRLIAHTLACDEHLSVLEQTIDGRLRHDGRDIDLDSLKGADRIRELAPEGVDHTRVPPGLILVGDAGVFLMSNGWPMLVDEPWGRADPVYAYACEADARSLSAEPAHQARRAFFGDPDGSRALPPSMLRRIAMDISEAPGEEGDAMYYGLALSPEGVALVNYPVLRADFLGFTPVGDEADRPSDRAISDLLHAFGHWPDERTEPAFDAVTRPRAEQLSPIVGRP